MAGGVYILHTYIFF